MKRRLLNFASALLLLLCIATVMMWARSYCSYDRFAVCRGVTAWSVSSYKSSVRLEFTKTFGLDPEPHLSCDLYSHRFTDGFPVWYREPQFLGFGAFAYGVGAGPYGPAWYQHIDELAIPYWFVVAALSVLPVTRRALRHRMLFRSLSQRCVACGYNLTGNTSGACPECGKSVPQKQGAGA